MNDAALCIPYGPMRVLGAIALFDVRGGQYRRCVS